MCIKLWIIFIVMMTFIISPISIIGQDTELKWIKTSKQDSKFSTYPLFKNDMTNRLTNEYNAFGDADKINYIFDGVDGENEKKYYFDNNTFSAYIANEDFICLRDIFVSGVFNAVAKDKDIASGRSDETFAITPYIFIYFNLTNSSYEKSIPRNNGSLLWTLKYTEQGVWQKNDFYNSVVSYNYVNGNPIICKNLFLTCPEENGRYFDITYDPGSWSNQAHLFLPEDGVHTAHSWDESTKKQTYNLFLAKSPYPRIEGYKDSDGLYKYFSPSEGVPTPHNYLWNAPINITTDYRVKILVLNFYKKNADGTTYTLLDKTLVEKIKNGDIISQNGIKQISIPAYHITEAGDYAMELGVVDKFNKMYLFEPQYFRIVDPTITVTKYELSNYGNNFHDVTGVLLTDKINTNNDSIKLRITTTINNLYEFTANNNFSFSSSVVSRQSCTSDLQSGTSQTFYVCPEIDLGKLDKSLSGNISLTFNPDPKLSKTISCALTPVNINYVPDINAISIGNVEPIPVSITAPARQRELLLWSNDTFREDSTIWDNDESLNGKDFTINNTVMFNIPIDISSDVNLIKLTVRRKNTSGSLPLIYYFKINTSRTIVTCYDNTGAVKTDFSIGLIANGNTIIKIIKPVYYSDFFDENKDIPEKSFPVDLFGKEFDAQVKGIKYFDHNYYYNPNNNNYVLITNTSDIQTKIINNLDKNGIEIFFDDDFDFNERAISSKQNDKIELAKSMNTPPFPSRVVYSNFRRDVANNDMVDFYIKPKLTSETCLNDTYNYKIIVMKDSVYQEKYKNDENFIKTKLLEDLNVAGDIPDNNVWNYNATDKMYISKWISWSGNNSPLHMGNDKFRFIENKSNDPEGKLHFFTIMKYKDADGTTYKYTNEYRHSAVRIDDSLTVIEDPGDLFDGNNNPVIHERVTFTKDVFVPEGKSLTFGYGSSYNSTKWKKVISNVELANNVKIIVRGTLNINNKYGYQSATKYIYLGPNGLNPDPDNVTKIDNSGDAADYLQIDKNGMWGGIYVLNTGVLKIDGGIINGAYDGIILYSLSESVKTSLKNCEIKYNEIGLQLYNSYPVIGDNVFIEGNLLYGVKEDNMIGKGVWKFNNGNLDKIKGNYINYYDDKGAVIK